MKIKSKLEDKENLEKIVKDSLSKAQVLYKLEIKAAGGNYKTLDKYILLYNIDTSHFTGKVWNQKERYRPFGKVANLEDILVENSLYSSSTSLRKKLLKEGLKIHKCESCNLSKWLEKLIPLELDHINGINNDNRIENLRLLCPNCHAQTDTYRGKNIRRNKHGCDEIGST